MRGLLARCACAAAAIMAVGSSVSFAQDAVIRVAAFRCDVTPPLGHLIYPSFKPLEKIEHPLLAKGIVLDDGQQRYVLCAVDWLTIGNSTHALFRRKIAEGAGTDPARVAVQTVQQHTAPLADIDAIRLVMQSKFPPFYPDPKFFEEMAARVGEAVKDSVGRLQPFDRVGTGEGKVERVASNRRIFDENGKLLQRWSYVEDPALRAAPEGLVDPMLKTITFAQGEKPLVRLHYYACHPQTFFRDPRVSYDFPGMAREALEQKEKVPQIYFTGCCGDITVGKYNEATPACREELSQRLRAGMEAAITATRLVPVEPLQWRTAELRLPLPRDAAEMAAKYRAQMNEVKLSAEWRLYGAHDAVYVARIAQPLLASSLQIGRIHILNLPGECTLDFQLFAQQAAPGHFVAVTICGDYGPGYILTDKSLAEGGYEASYETTAPGTEAIVKTAIVNLIGAK